MARAVSARVICISRESGADGEAVGRAVAERLGLQYVDDEVITRASERAGVDADVLQDTEGRKSLLRRVAEFFADSGTAASASVEPSPIRRAREQEHRELIRAVIEDVAEDGSAVIVAHAASMALAGRDGILRVLVAGSPGVRAERLAAREHLDAQAAEKLVHDADADRAAYLKSFYGVDRELPVHYDVVVNTDRLGADRAADLIVHTAEQLG
jgi:cytidylate kinase